MLLEELLIGQLVNIELKMEKDKYEIVTQVIGTSENTVLVDPVFYKNQIVKISSDRMKSAVLNLYADDQDGKRVGWMNIHVDVKDYKDHRYYVIRTNNFNKHSVHTDRRKNDRVSLDYMKSVVITKGGNEIPVSLKDISANGISFLYPTMEKFGSTFTIQVDDHVHDEDFSFKLKCHCIRQQEMEQQVLYGCNIVETNPKLLSYLFWKPLYKESVEKLMYFSE